MQHALCDVHKEGDGGCVGDVADEAAEEAAEDAAPDTEGEDEE